ncbi:MAG: hypothetical protein ACRCYO_02500 [Bacteroidia bacterium]
MLVIHVSFSGFKTQLIGFRSAFLLPFLLVCLTSVPVFGQVDSLSPLQVVDRYISPNGFTGKAPYFCCELASESRANSTLGQLLPKTVKRSTHLISQDSTRAIVSVWLHDSITSRDFYIYLGHNKTRWVMICIRSLVLTDAARDEIKRLDSVPIRERGKVYSKKTGRDWNFERNNTLLWLAADTELVLHFRQQQKAFESARKQIVKEKLIAPGDTVCGNVMTHKKIVKQLDRALIREVTMDRGYPGTLLFVIGGIGDNAVGYMYQPDPTKLPPCNTRYYILIRSLGNGWYLYKTT